MFTIYLKIYMVKLNIYMLTWSHAYMFTQLSTWQTFPYLHDEPLL